MRTPIRALLILVLFVPLAACSGGTSTPRCSLKDPAALATTSPWPKFRADLHNTGTVANAMVAMNSGQLDWVFPPQDEPAKGAFSASPVLSSDGTVLYIGSNDGVEYGLHTADGTRTAFNLAASAPITSTALIGRRDAKDAIFVADGNGQLHGLTESSVIQATNWPTAFGSFVSTSPTISETDGTLFLGASGGLFFGVCPNGVERFNLSFTGVQSSAAIDGTGLKTMVYVGADDRLLRAVTYNGIFKWSFAASAPIATAVVMGVESTGTFTYVADRGGRVFKVDTAGRPASQFTQFGAAVGPISSSPALANGRLYFGSDDGNLYAIDATTGAKVWAAPFATGDVIVSSPAVATGGANPVIVFGSNDGTVYFVEDTGAAPMLMAMYTIGAPVRSSPAIGSDGVIYIGADDGRVYALK